MNEGTIIFFDSINRFGIIRNEETKEEIDVYIPSLYFEKIDSFKVGQKVTFDIEQDLKDCKKARAVNVCLKADDFFL